MSSNDYYITEKKISLKTDNAIIPKGKIKLKVIRNNLLQPLFTQTSKKQRYFGVEESTDRQTKYRNNLGIKNIETSNSVNYDYYKLNNQSIKTEKLTIKSVRNDNEILAYFSAIKDKTSRNNTFIDSTLNTNNNNNNQFFLNSLSTVNDERDKTLVLPDNNSNLYALSDCKYHKFNLSLPKKYICNFKHCNDTPYLNPKKLDYKKKISNTENENDYIYPKNLQDKKSARYRTVLDKFKKNDLNYSYNLSCDEFLCNFLKPNNTNLRFKKKIYEVESESESESSFIELPDSIGMEDGKDLDDFRNSIINKKTNKIHFSVMYYKKLNKCYQEINSKDFVIDKNNNNNNK